MNRIQALAVGLVLVLLFAAACQTAAPADVAPQEGAPPATELAPSAQPDTTDQPDPASDPEAGPEVDAPGAGETDEGDETTRLRVIRASLTPHRDYPGNGGGEIGDEMPVTPGDTLVFSRDGHSLALYFDDFVEEDAFRRNLRVEPHFPYELQAVAADGPPGEEPQETRYFVLIHMRQRLAPGREVRLTVDEGLSSENGFVLAEPVAFVLRGAAEPRVERLAVLGYPHIEPDTHDLDPLDHSLPAGPHEFEVAFSRPMDRASVEQTLARRLGQAVRGWNWLDDRTARFQVNVTGRISLDFDGAADREGITVWEPWSLHLLGHEPQPIVAVDPRTGSTAERFRVPITPCAFIHPAPTGSTVLVAENRGSVGDPCLLNPLFIDPQDPLRSIRRAAPQYAGWGRGSLRPLWAPDGSRVYLAGGMVDLTAGTGFQPVLPDLGSNAWAGWALDPEGDRLALLWMEYESARLDLVVTRNGQVLQRFEDLGLGAREAGFVHQNELHWLAGRNAVLLEASVQGEDAVLRVDLDSREVSTVAAGLRQPVPAPIGDLLVAADPRTGGLALLTLEGEERWRAVLDGGSHRSVHWSPDGTLIAVTQPDGPFASTVVVFDANDGSVVWESRGHAVGWEAGTGRLLIYHGRLAENC